MQDQIVRQKQHQCPFCKEILSDDYIEQNPYSQIQCPACGSLIEISSDEEESAPQNIGEEERCDISLRVTYKSFDRFIIDYTNNVSKGGMFIKTKLSCETGSRLDLLLHVPDLDGPIRIMGRVIHNSFSGKDEDPGIGVQFVDIDEKSREILMKGLKKQKE